MDHSLFVRGLERLGDLPGDGKHVAHGTGPARDAFGQRLAFDQLHDDGRRGVALLQAVDLSDVRMVQRGEHTRFPREARHSIGVTGEFGQQDFHRNVAVQLGIVCPVDLTHSTAPDQRPDRKGVQPDPRQHGIGGRLQHQRGNCGDRLLQEHFCAGDVRKDGFDFMLDAFIAAAGFAQERVAVTGYPLQCRLTDLLDLTPPIDVVGHG